MGWFDRDEDIYDRKTQTRGWYRRAWQPHPPTQACHRTRGRPMGGSQRTRSGRLKQCAVVDASGTSYIRRGGV